MGFQTSVSVPVGYALTLTSVSAGSYYVSGNPGDEPSGYGAISAGSSVELGPFNTVKNYILHSDNNDLAYSLSYSGVYDEDAALPDLAAPLASPTFTGTVTLPTTWKVGSTTILPTGTELNYVDGVTSAIQTQLNAKAPIVSGGGTVETGVTAVEFGDAKQHTTVLTIDSTLPAITGGVDQAVGKLLYTFPAGAIVIDKAHMNVSITQTEANITADTPDVGLGTVIGTGAVATLDTTPTFEDILTGQTFNDCDGTAEVKTVANQILVIESGDAHTVHLNVADGFAADGDAAAAIAGTVVLHWQLMG